MTSIPAPPYPGEFLSIHRRIIASIIDKAIIILLFGIASLLIIGIYSAPGELGAYSAILGMSPEAYEYSNQYNMHEIDFNFTCIFVFTNILYYTLFECLLGASLGKRVLGGVLINSKKEKIVFSNVLARNAILLLMILLAIACRWIFNTSYWVVIISFFLIMDLPIFFSETSQSLIDRFSSTYLVKRRTITF